MRVHSRVSLHGTVAQNVTLDFIHSSEILRRLFNVIICSSLKFVRDQLMNRKANISTHTYCISTVCYITSSSAFHVLGPVVCYGLVQVFIGSAR
jgi:hypothetical protein